MTVADLRKLLDKLPDDAPVLVRGGEDFEHQLDEPLVSFVAKRIEFEGATYWLEGLEDMIDPALVLL